MKAKAEHMAFKNGTERIQIVHLSKPIKYGLAGMASSKLFPENVAIVISDRLNNDGVLLAALSQKKDGSAPRIEVERELFYEFKRGSVMARFIILHELGHYKNRDILQENMKEYDERRSSVVAGGNVAEAELRADGFAASFLGRETARTALTELRDHVRTFYAEHDGFADVADLALSEINLRIASI